MSLSAAQDGDRAYAGVSAAARRSARRGRLIDALLDLVHEAGVETLSVGAVCARAGVSKRHFYEGFSGLDRLAGEALTEGLAPVARRIAIVAGASRQEVIEAAVEAVLVVFDDPRLARLYLQAPGQSGLREAREHAVAAFARQLLTVLTHDAQPGPGAYLIAHTVIAATTEAVTLWLRGDVDLDRHELMHHMTSMGLDALDRIDAVNTAI